MSGHDINPIIAQALEITKTYQEYYNAPVAIREAMCLKKQYPQNMGEIQKGDLFAGRKAKDRILYVGPIWWFSFPNPWNRKLLSEGKQGGYCFDFSAIDRLELNPAEKEIMKELNSFWENEATVCKYFDMWDSDIRNYTAKGGFISAAGNGFASAVDLDRLVQKGIPGLYSDVRNKKKEFREKNQDVSFFTGLEIALDVLVDVCRYYEKQAMDFAKRADSPKEQVRLMTIAQTLNGIIEHPPQTFREAIQLIWIYSLLCCGKHLEAYALDVALGDLYVRDIEHKIITEEEAVDMLLSLWRLFNENGEDATCRIGLGGKGRRNESNADRFALAAMEATARHKRVTPQLMLRLYKGQNTELLRKAFDTISESYTYPMLYNDDAVIPGVVKTFNVSEEEAAHYHPFGCGELMLGARSPSVLVCTWNTPRTLEAALHNGCSIEGQRIGPETGPVESFDTFEKLFDAFVKQTEFAANISAKAYQKIIEVNKNNCAFLYASLLTHDCLERGRAALDGGMRYIGACLMGHGLVTAADALAAIKKVVYQEKRITLKEVVEALDSDFAGFEDVRKMLLNAPKYGNDNDDADSILAAMWEHIDRASREAGIRAGLDFHTVSNVNPGGYGMGFESNATADGRKKGQPYAIGNSPTSGFDKSGLTSMLNSVSKIGPVNGGVVTNMKISKEFLTGERTKLETLFNVYFSKGGLQANITVVSKNDLEAALAEPEKYSHILVRVGGWSARFIDLDRRIQEDIIRRTMY